ncbi:unnamed protein product [Pleuronectes platessa]|uniref:Uncharacterized protein n=1 Tax=Pleuronectes platessa TaxID=8262 RepID=A0A9N7UC23_PLEPL|nr:unnamed protein product [Pleuronectes platessa]
MAGATAVGEGKDICCVCNRADRRPPSPGPLPLSHPPPFSARLRLSGAARTGASDTCVARGSGGESRGGAGLTSPATVSLKCPAATEVMALLGPGPCGCSTTRPSTVEPRVRSGQGRTNEVRAAVLGDLCPSEAPIAFWLLH